MNHGEACSRLALDPAVFPPTKSAVDAAYRKAALATHPDRGGTEEEFHAVAEAKAVLFLEIETGKPISKEEELGDGASGGAQPSAPRHCWAGAKYDVPSTQSPLSPLRQMGKPIDMGTVSVDDIVRLWRHRQIQCVWRCEECDAVCCRVRREKFRCVCGHTLREHDPAKGFACRCQAKKVAHSSAVHKGDCRCKAFHFLVSHGAWTVKCRCKHDHWAHDPKTLECRRCGVDAVGGCDDGWNPSFQCHCGHTCGSHRTAFVHGHLGEGHRDWVVSGVRLECARQAEKFRARPLDEQVRLRAAAGLGDFNLFSAADMFTPASKPYNRPHQRAAAKKRHDREEAGSAPSETFNQPAPGGRAMDKWKSNLGNFERNQIDASEAAERHQANVDRIRAGEDIELSFSPRTNHKKPHANATKVVAPLWSSKCDDSGEGPAALRDACCKEDDSGAEMQQHASNGEAGCSQDIGSAWKSETERKGSNGYKLAGTAEAPKTCHCSPRAEKTNSQASDDDSNACPIDDCLSLLNPQAPQTPSKRIGRGGVVSSDSSKRSESAALNSVPPCEETIAAPPTASPEPTEKEITIILTASRIKEMVKSTAQKCTNSANSRGAAKKPSVKNARSKAKVTGFSSYAALVDAITAPSKIPKKLDAEEKSSLSLPSARGEPTPPAMMPCLNEPTRRISEDTPPALPITPTAAGMCYTFKRGSCQRGSGCRFSHDGDTAATETTELIDAIQEPKPTGEHGGKAQPDTASALEDSTLVGDHAALSLSSKFDDDGRGGAGVGQGGDSSDARTWLASHGLKGTIGALVDVAGADHTEDLLLLDTKDLDDLGISEELQNRFWVAIANETKTFGSPLAS